MMESNVYIAFHHYKNQIIQRMIWFLQEDEGSKKAELSTITRMTRIVILAVA